MRTLLCILASILASQSAPAQARSVSRSEWIIAQDQVMVREIIPAAEAHHLKPAGLPPSNEELAAYVLDHVGVNSQGSVCRAIDQGYDLGRVNTLAAGPGLYGFEIIFHCPHITPPVLSNTVLQQVPEHIDYAHIELDGAASEQVFTARHFTLDLSVHPASAGFSTYAALGARHVGRSWQRLCFLLGLALLIKSRREGWMAVMALCCGYAVAVLIPIADQLPRMPALESAIGLLVALCAAQWVARRMPVSPRVGLGITAALALVCVAVGRGMGEVPWSLMGAALLSGSLLTLSSRRPFVALIGLPLLFGLLDGVVLAGDYARLQMWTEFKAGPQMFFNLGALSVELGIMAVLLGGKAWWGRSRQRAGYSPLAEEVAATALAGLGAFWLVVQLKG
jgi:hypothetical protein